MKPASNKHFLISILSIFKYSIANLRVLTSMIFPGNNFDTIGIPKVLSVINR